jgi:hypothetical protein
MKSKVALKYRCSSTNAIVTFQNQFVGYKVKSHKWKPVGLQTSISLFSVLSDLKKHIVCLFVKCWTLSCLFRIKYVRQVRTRHEEMWFNATLRGNASNQFLVTSVMSETREVTVDIVVVAKFDQTYGVTLPPHPPSPPFWISLACKCKRIFRNVFKLVHDKWVPVITARRVLGLRMEERPPDMESSCEYIE